MSDRVRGVRALEATIINLGAEMSIVWRPAMSTGLAWQDEQHKEILRRIDQLVDAIEKNQGASVIGELLEFLGEYVDRHFRSEEAFMRKSGCGSCELHAECHRVLRENLAEIKATFNRHGASTMVVVKMQSLVRDWLINHVLAIDKQTAAEVNQMIATAIPHQKSQKVSNE